MLNIFLRTVFIEPAKGLLITIMSLLISLFLVYLALDYMMSIDPTELFKLN